MSGTRFLTKLKELGCPDVDLEMGDAFDWLSDDPDVGAVIEWFCDNVDKNNVLTDSEIAKFKELEESGAMILDGEALEEAVIACASDDDDKDEDDLEDEVASLEEEVAFLKKKKDLLMEQRKLFTHQQSERSEKSSQVKRLDHLAEADSNEANEKCQKINQKVNHALQQMTQAVSSVSTLYTQTLPPGSMAGAGDVSLSYEGARGGSSSTSSSQPPRFISQGDLTRLYQIQEKHQQVLTEYTKKVFTKEMAEISAHADAAQYQLLDYNNPDLELIQGPDQQELLETCRDLSRRHKLFPHIREKLLISRVQAAGAKAANDFLEKKLDQITPAYFPKNSQELRNRLEATRHQLEPLQNEYHKLTSITVPQAIKDLVDAQITKVLCGNYEYKIARQDLFLSKQDKLIEFLVDQRAINEFLFLSYDIEQKKHRHIRQLLTSISLLLGRHRKAFEARKSMLQDPMLQPQNQQRQTLDSSDHLMQALHDLLALATPVDEPQLFKTHEQIIEGAKVLNQQVKKVEDEKSSAALSEKDQLARMEDHLARCQLEVYRGSTTMSGPPPLSSASITRPLDQLEASVKKVENDLREVLKDIDHKKKVLRADQYLHYERELFANFHCNPARLRKVLDDVQAKLEAYTRA